MVQCQFVADRSFLDIASLGQRVPWIIGAPVQVIYEYDPVECVILCQSRIVMKIIAVVRRSLMILTDDKCSSLTNKQGDPKPDDHKIIKRKNGK